MRTSQIRLVRNYCKEMGYIYKNNPKTKIAKIINPENKKEVQVYSKENDIFAGQEKLTYNFESAFKNPCNIRSTKNHKLKQFLYGIVTLI